MKAKIKKILSFVIGALFFISILGFLFLILSDRSYGGGAVIFIFSIWGLFEYAKWVNKTFNPQNKSTKEKYKIFKTNKDFIQFIKEKSDTENDEEWLFGNFPELTEGDVRKTDSCEMKYWTFTKNENPNHELKLQHKAAEYTFIIKGEIVGRVEDEEVTLKTGDYIIIKPGVVNNLVERVVENVIGITIKSPSNPSKQQDTIKIKK